MPGTLGGANWSGASFDPSSGYLFVNTSDLGVVGEMKKEPDGSPETFSGEASGVLSLASGTISITPASSRPGETLSAVNLNTGEIAWKVPLGVVDALQAKGIPRLGFITSAVPS